MESGDDLNNITTPGFYKFTNGAPANCPITMGACIVRATVLSASIKEVIQIAFDPRGGGNGNNARPMYQRMAWTDSSNGWTKWSRIYDESILTDSSSLTSLASALGVINYKGTISSDDLNNYTSSGYWWGLSGNTNTPIANLNSFILEVITMGTSNLHLLQRISFVVVNTITVKVYQRMGNVSGGVLTWSDWKEFN